MIPNEYIIPMAAMFLGSNLLTAWLTKYFERRQTQAGTIKLRNESGQIILEGELKVTEFYKKQLEAILEKYTNLETKLDIKIKDHEKCENKIIVLQNQYHDLQRQFTLLKTQVSGLI